MEEIKIYYEKIPKTDPRLGRNIRHDSRSLNFAFDTTGLTIQDVDHERYLPILDQGNLGSCTGNAGVGVIHTHPFINQENAIYPGNEDGAVKLYSDATKIDPFEGQWPPQDTGSDSLSIAKVLLAKGLISGYQHVFSLEDALKTLSKYPLLVGTNWYSDMFNPDALGNIHPTGSLAGGHEYFVTRCRKNEKKVGMPNSWSEKWGDHGYFYLTFEEFGDLLSKRGDAMVLFPPVATPPQPIVIRTLRLKSPQMQGQDVTDLQNVLIGLKYLNDYADGIFGPATKQAVILFQNAHGLRGDGIVGPLTRALIEKGISPTSKIDLWCEAIKAREGWELPNPNNPLGSLSYRNNNPGNLEFKNQKYAVANGRFACFDKYEHGYQALKTMLIRACSGLSSVYRPEMTLYTFYDIYAPKSDSNDPKGYAEYVAKRLGVEPNIIIKNLL